MAGWLGLILGFTSLFIYSVLPDLKSLSASLAAVAMINGVFFVVVERSRLKQSFSSRSVLYGTNTLILTIIVLGILIFINLLAFRHKQRFDFTEGGFYTLAPQTKKLVSNLPREVKLTAFFQTESPEKIAFADLIAGYLEETNNIKLHYIDPDKNPAVTKQYGVTTYGTVALESGTKETRIQNPTEENITNALLKVTRDEQKVIYFLEGHGENNIEGNDDESYSTAKKNLEQDGFIAKRLLLLQSGKVPEDASVLVVAGPKKPIQEEEKKIIDDYLNSGGAVFMLIDPKSESNMETFLKKWGIANSLHPISMAFELIGFPKTFRFHQFGSLDWHPSGSIFVGSGISEKNIPFSYHADWNSAGRWGIEIMTRKNAYRLISLEELFKCKIDTDNWEKIEFKKSFPNVKQGLAEEIAVMLDKSLERKIKLVNLEIGYEIVEFGERIFGYN